MTFFTKERLEVIGCLHLLFVGQKYSVGIVGRRRLMERVFGGFSFG